jgi:hypothetical protein
MANLFGASASRTPTACSTARSASGHLRRVAEVHRPLQHGPRRRDRRLHRRPHRQVQGAVQAPGGGFMQKRGRNGRPGAVKASGSWDVAYPLHRLRRRAGVRRRLDGLHDGRRVHAAPPEHHEPGRQHVPLRAAPGALQQAGYTSPTSSTATCPSCPWPTATARSTRRSWARRPRPRRTYYAGTNYAHVGDLDTNNPVKTAVASSRRGSAPRPAARTSPYFYNSAEHDKLSALTDFVKVQYQYVEAGDNTATVKIPGIPDELLGGSWEVTGTCSGAVMCKWDQIPAATRSRPPRRPPPLIERVDPADTGLGTGLQLVAEGHGGVLRDALLAAPLRPGRPQPPQRLRPADGRQRRPTRRRRSSPDHPDRCPWTWPASPARSRS